MRPVGAPATGVDEAGGELAGGVSDESEPPPPHADKTTALMAETTQ
ncbi:hypothetical protein IMCC9480_2530 [Oxalobacteraceae bacterium IMCC9480]|nr:hypothetical protein IMCC9480_2530 [Oxalobacteraceae bacterium IMCC9480]